MRQSNKSGDGSAHPRHSIISGVLRDTLVRDYSVIYLFNYWLATWLTSLAGRAKGQLKELLQACWMAIKRFAAEPDLCLFLLPKVATQLCYPDADRTGDPYTLGDPDALAPFRRR